MTRIFFTRILSTRALSSIAGLVTFACALQAAADWITAPSYYTHDPQTGERVRQYSPIGPFYMAQRDNYTRSGFHHTRSSIQVGTNADQMHIVDQWGPPVQPYEDWRFPFRPYGAPSPLWSNMSPWAPNGQWGPWGGGPWNGGQWGGGPGPMGPNQNGPNPGGPYPGGNPMNGNYPYNGYYNGLNAPAWQDGNYTPFRTPRLPDQQFYSSPGQMGPQPPRPAPVPPPVESP